MCLKLHCLTQLMLKHMIYIDMHTYCFQMKPCIYIYICILDAVLTLDVERLNSCLTTISIDKPANKAVDTWMQLSINVGMYEYHVSYKHMFSIHR